MNFKKKLRDFFTLTKRSKGGFTLVELIVVIAILAILAGVAIPVYSGYVKKAEKAGDEQLLAAVNKAFTAAVSAAGDDITAIDAEDVKLTVGSDGKIVITSLTPDKYQADFAMFYQGNENSAFKGYSDIKYDDDLHVFKGVEGDVAGGSGNEAYNNALNKILATMPDQVQTVKDSAYAAMGANKLMGAVNDVTTFAGLAMGNEEGKIAKMVTDEEYLDNVRKMMGMTPDEFDAYCDENPDKVTQILANSTVLSVANTVTSAEYETAKQQLIADLSSGKLSDVIGAITEPEQTSQESLAAAALIYGLYTAYDPEGAATITATGDFSKIPTAGGEGSFMEYLSKLGTDDTDAQKAMEGYFAALDIVNTAIQDTEVSKQVLVNGYADTDLIALVGSVIGN